MFDEGTYQVLVNYYWYDNKFCNIINYNNELLLSDINIKKLLNTLIFKDNYF